MPLGWQIHHIFHISKLKHYIHSEEFLREVELPPPILVGDTLEYEVEGILWHQGTRAWHRYLVLWKGYPLTEATWEPESHLTNAPDILEQYLCWVETQDRGNTAAVVCHLGAENSKFLLGRMGTNGVGASAVKDGRVTLWHRSWPPSS